MLTYNDIMCDRFLRCDFDLHLRDLSGDLLGKVRLCISLPKLDLSTRVTFHNHSLQLHLRKPCEPEISERKRMCYTVLVHCYIPPFLMDV